MTKLRLAMNSVLIVICLSLLSPKEIEVWRWNDAKQVVETVPASVLQSRNLQMTPNTSLISTENCIDLASRHLTVSRCRDTSTDGAWQSPENWQVTEVVETDLDRDGHAEIAMVVWRPFAPWPIDRFLPDGDRIAEFHDKDNLSTHLILVGWDGDEYRELWAGSALANPISDIQAADIDGDGFEELIALESDYNSINKTGNITIWRWQGFGFALFDRMEGQYSNYAIYKTDQQTLILTD